MPSNAYVLPVIGWKNWDDRLKSRAADSDSSQFIQVRGSLHASRVRYRLPIADISAKQTHPTHGEEAMRNSAREKRTEYAERSEE